jgi:hypothetical protein
MAICITPVSIYHDLFADHSDIHIEHNHFHGSEVAKAGIDCDDIGFVADKNYLFTITSVNFKCRGITCIFYSKPGENFYSQHHFYAELRGPPAVI